MEQRSDEELLADHIAEKPGVFEQLAARYANELFGFLLRFVGNGTVAEDLVQETFLQVHLAASSFDPARSFKPWLYTIAANKARDFLRARGRRQELSLDNSGPNDEGPTPGHMLEAAGVAAAEQFDNTERAATVRSLIAEMPENLRLILMLGYYQRLPYAEISEILDIPVGTVKSRLHSAVTHFAKLWQSRTRSSPTAER
ncbi:MAG: sigma-70 family RNA polymerase sigma factor [Planctomycetes bacterium]|nr:sigma-70 family RNA polymerase sigma factor [Planctomycetota bacterium]